MKADMCERAKEEPLWQYWFRQFKEEPLRVMILMTTGAMVWLYQDGNARWEQYRQDMKEQQSLLIEHIKTTNSAISELKGPLQVIDGRLLHLEREHEAARQNN